jgi:hypothetical protein
MSASRLGPLRRPGTIAQTRGCRPFSRAFSGSWLIREIAESGPVKEASPSPQEARLWSESGMASQGELGTRSGPPRNCDCCAGLSIRWLPAVPPLPNRRWVWAPGMTFSSGLTFAACGRPRLLASLDQAGKASGATPKRTISEQFARTVRLTAQILIDVVRHRIIEFRHEATHCADSPWRSMNHNLGLWAAPIPIGILHHGLVERLPQFFRYWIGRRIDHGRGH